MKFLTFSLLLPIGLSTAASAQAEAMLGLGLDGGVTSTTSSEALELDKDGGTVSGYLGLSLEPIVGSYFTVGLGIHSDSIDGSSARRNQDVKTQSALLLLDYRMAFGSFEPGLVIRTNIGDGSSLRVQDENERKTTINIGPELAYRWKHSDSDLVAYLSATWDANVNREVNRSILLGIQHWFHSSNSSKQIAATKPDPVVREPTPSKPPVVEEATSTIESEIVVLHFKEDVFSFAKNSAQLAENSKNNAQEIAIILARDADTWTNIEVGGHTDAGGNYGYNQNLSQKRADSVRTILIENGVSANAITAKGFASDELLADVPKDAAENRRVELKIFGVKDGSGLSKSLSKFLLN